MKLIIKIVVCLGLIVSTNSCTKKFLCECSQDGQKSWVYAKKLEDAKNQCHDKEYYNGGSASTGSGTCWIH